jgi:hypothetical protein
MPSSWKFGFTIAFLSCLSTLLTAQQAPPSKSQWYPATPVGQAGAVAGTIPTPMEMLPQVAPIFFEDGKTESALVILNNSEFNAGANISVRSLSGAEIVRTHRALKAHEQQELPLQLLLSGLAAPPSIGSIAVSQDPELKGLTVVSQLLITNHRGGLPSYIDEELAMPAIGGSTTLRGVADERWEVRSLA